MNQQAQPSMANASVTVKNKNTGIQGKKILKAILFAFSGDDR